MPLPGSKRNQQFLQEINEPVHEEVLTEKPLSQMTKKELVEKAEDMGIIVSNRWTKSELVTEIMSKEYI